MKIMPVSYFSYKNPKSKTIAQKQPALASKTAFGHKADTEDALVEELAEKYPDKADIIRKIASREIIEIALHGGVYRLKEVAAKSPKDKEESVDILKNLAKVADKRALRENYLYGIENDSDFYPGIVTALEDLTGEDVDVEKLLGRV